MADGQVTREAVDQVLDDFRDPETGRASRGWDKSTRLSWERIGWLWRWA